MQPIPSQIQRLCFIFLVAVFGAIFAGCATPKVTLISKEPLQTYKVVRLVVPDPDPRKVHPRIVSRLRGLGFDVREVTADGEGGDSQGTGFIVSDTGHVLTCAHVVGTNGAATLWVQGRRFEATVLARDTNTDLALLQIAGEKRDFKPLAILDSQPVKLGQPVFLMGFPLIDVLGKNARLSKGLVSSTVGLSDDTNQVQISAEVQPGNSGSPLLTDDGHFAGVVVGTLNALRVLVRSGGTLPQNVNFATKANLAQAFLQTNGVHLVHSVRGTTNTFEEIQDSLALVRGGVIPPGEEDRAELGCVYSYISHWDMWYRFRAFQIVFVDLKSGKLLLKAGQYRDNPVSTEDGVLDRAFKEIGAQFFPTNASLAPPKK